MQIKGKILTIAGIVLLFGYFIMESFKNPSSVDPNQIIMVGNDTLGRDWNALADRKEQEKIASSNEQVESVSSEQGNYNKPLISETEDPYSKEKFNYSNYSTIQSPDGREIITDYNNPYEQEGDQEDIDNGDNYQTRHQKEKGQPAIPYSVE